MKRKVVASIVIVAIIALGAFSAVEFFPKGLAMEVVNKAESLGKPPELAPKAPRPVSLHTVARKGAVQSRTYPGIAASSHEVELAFRVAGPLVAVNVSPGVTVAKGEALMQIDPRDYEDNIAVLEAQLAGAEAALEKVRLDYERTKPLKRKNVVSQSDYDQAESAHRTAQAKVHNIKAQLQKARHALEDTTLRAPFDGIVSAQLLENHEMVASGQKALKLQDISKVEIHVNVPENELGHYDLRQQHTAQVTFPAFPGSCYTARLTEWSAEADPGTRTYEVTFALPAPEDVIILPGMTAELQWGASRTKNPPLSIPASAVTSSPEGHSMVWVYDAATGTAESRRIETGSLLDDAYMRVLQGLAPGEQIVAAGVDFIAPGMKLRPLKAQSP